NDSASLQCPGPANCSSPFCPNPIKDMLSYLSLMSPVVLHKLPVFGPHRHGAFTPQLQMLNTIGRPDCASASRSFAYCTSGSRPSELHQSIFTYSIPHTASYSTPRLY